MTVYRNPLEAYQTVDRMTMSGRETEARVLAQAALKLKDCQGNWDGEDRNVKLDEALKYNQRIWSILQSELAREDNLLPGQLKQALLRLGVFIDR